VRLKDKLRKARTEDDKTIIHDQICEIQKRIADDIEAKDQAAQMRISNFYKLATGKMVPESFTCNKDLKRDRGIHKLQHDGQTITDPEEIPVVRIMQKLVQEHC